MKWGAAGLPAAKAQLFILRHSCPFFSVSLYLRGDGRPALRAQAAEIAGEVTAAGVRQNALAVAEKQHGRASKENQEERREGHVIVGARA